MDVHQTGKPKLLGLLVRPVATLRAFGLERLEAHVEQEVRTALKAPVVEALFSSSLFVVGYLLLLFDPFGLNPGWVVVAYLGYTLYSVPAVWKRGIELWLMVRQLRRPKFGQRWDFERLNYLAQRTGLVSADELVSRVRRGAWLGLKLFVADYLLLSILAATATFTRLAIQHQDDTLWAGVAFFVQHLPGSLTWIVTALRSALGI